jgi:NAD(P)-dependent dehydrogenase (short-subunit alcohol dehydrogenase family)
MLIDAACGRALLLDDSSLSDEHARLVNQNRDSWELGAISSGYTWDTVLDTLGILTTGITVQMDDLQDHHSETGSSCGEDLEDLVYLAERFGMVSDILVNNAGLVASFFVKDREEWDGHFFSTPVCLTDKGALTWSKNWGDVEVKSP